MSTNGQASVMVEPDVVFGTGGGRELRCDIHRPAADAGKRTALVLFHGGGFRGGSRGAIAARAAHFAAAGHVCIAAEYRLTGEATWPAQLHDAKAAIRWTRANAGMLGVDADRIGVGGFSAGGLLALVTAGSGNTLELEGDGGNEGVGSQAAVCLGYYPVVEMRPAPGDFPLLPADSTEQMIASASTYTQISASFPPTVLFHGTEDTTIPLASSVRLFDALREAGVAAEIHAMEGVPHAFDRHPEMGEACAVMVDLFLDRHVVNPRVYPPFAPGAVVRD